MANARGPESLKDLAAKTGAIPVTWISCLLHESDEGGTSVVVKKSRPFFTSRRPREGIEGVLPNKGCGLPSPNQSPSIGINKRIKQENRCCCGYRATATVAS